MLKRLLLLLAVCTAPLGALSAPIVINVNAKDGDVISGEFVFRVTVQAEHLVTSVEFYVGDDLRDTDSSTPYQFTVDTLAEQEGDFIVTFAAYTAQGESAKKTVTVRIDNGIDKGAQFHIDRGLEALAVGEWDTALQAGRVALRIEPTNNSARLVMARANLGKGVLDLAQKFAEDIVTADPDNAPALALLSAINLQRAFNTVNMAGADPRQTAEVIRAALIGAATSRRRALDQAVDAFGAATDDNLLEFADLMASAGRYSLAIDELNRRFQRDQRDPEVANRLIYAQIRAGRLADAQVAWSLHERFGTPDGYGFALKAILASYRGDAQASLDAEKEALLNDPANLGVRTAQAFLALRRGDVRTFAQISANLAQTEGHSTIINTYLSALFFFTGEFEQSRQAYETAMLAEPSNYDMLIERANQIVSMTITENMAGEAGRNHRNVAKAHLEAALAIRPESFEALTGMVIVHLMNGETDDALRNAQAAVAAGPEYAAAHYALAAAYTAARQFDNAMAALNKGEDLDPRGLGGRAMPTATQAWAYFYRAGRMPLIAPPSAAD